jgi:hypothetical protein
VPKFKTAKFSYRNAAGAEDLLTISIHVDRTGTFYAKLPDRLRPAIAPKFIAPSSRVEPGYFKAHAALLADLESAIEAAQRAAMTPEITEEPVIHYNIESHVAFALNDAGEIVPNAGFPNSAWPDKTAPSNGEFALPNYGGHHATNPASSGYSLAIGARALLKTTYRYGSQTRIKYSPFYSDGSHHGRSNPGELLNSWRAVGVGDRPKEIPYSDDAALFFHRLLLGMAEISRRVQEATFTQERLLDLIASSSGVVTLDFQPMRKIPNAQ